MYKKLFPTDAHPQGAARKIFFRANSSQEINKFSAWLQTKLTQEEQKSLYNLFRVCCSHKDVCLHHSPEKFKKEFDEIYVLKSFQVRLYGFLKARNFIIFYYMKKREIN